MDQILSGIDGVACYLDDILITARSTEQHLQRLDEVLSSGGAVAEWVRASTGDLTFDGSSPTSVKTFLFGTLAIPFTPLASVFRMRQ